MQAQTCQCRANVRLLQGQQHTVRLCTLKAAWTGWQGIRPVLVGLQAMALPVNVLCIVPRKEVCMAARGVQRTQDRLIAKGY